MNKQTILQETTLSHYRWLVFAICWMGGVFAGMDANLFSVILPQAISETAPYANRIEVGKLGSYVLASFLFGWMCGGILFGILIDYFGRVKCMATAIMLYTAFTGIAALTYNVSELAICRFAVGLGVGGTMLGISVFLSETWPSRSRAMALGALVTSYQLGVFLSGFVVHLFPHWRTAFIFGTVPIILSVLILKYFHESASWEKSKSAPLVAEEIPYKRNLLFGSIVFGSLLIGYWASLSWIPTWIQDLLGKNSMGHEKNMATMVHGICGILGCLASGKLADVLGRRPVLTSSLLGALFASLGMFLGCTTFSSFIYVLNGILGFFIGVTQSVMYIYLPELFSSKVRARCVGFCLNAGRLITVIAILFMGMIVSQLGGYAISLSMFALLYLVGAMAVWAIPETKAIQQSS